MDSTNSRGSSTIVSINKRRTVLTVELRQKNIPKTRRATNKSWIILFVVIFISWIVSSYDVIYHGTDSHFLPANTTFADYMHKLIRKKAIDNIILNDTEFSTNNTEFFDSENANVSNIYAGILKEEKRLKEDFETLHFFILVYTCNPSNFRNLPNNKKKELIIIGHIFFSIVYFAYAQREMRNNKIIRKQSWIVGVGVTFIFVAFLEHLSAVVYASNSIAFSPVPTHQRLSLWLIPEMIFLIILFSQLFSSVRNRNIGDNIAVDDNDSGNESDNELDDDSKNHSKEHLDNDIVPFSTYIPAIAIGVPTILILKVLMMSTMTILYKTSFLDVRFYIISIGSIYVGSTIFCFGLMVTSYASSIANKDSLSSICNNLANGLFIVARYHFGTACYHATLMFPKHVSFVMSESGWKPLRKDREKKEFRVKGGKIFKLSRTLTAVFGTNHSQSVKNILRLYCRDLITKKSFPGFKPFSKCLLAFLLATNCILITLLWSIGVVDDDLAMSTWIMYLKIAFVFSLAIEFFISTMDATELSGMRKVLDNFSDKDLYKDLKKLLK